MRDEDTTMSDDELDDQDSSEDLDDDEMQY